MAKTDRGYSVARVIALAGPGPSWELVATIVDFKSAIALALQLADAAGARAWIPTSAGLCEQIPPKLAR